MSFRSQKLWKQQQWQRSGRSDVPTAEAPEEDLATEQRRIRDAATRSSSPCIALPSVWNLCSWHRGQQFVEIEATLMGRILHGTGTGEG